MFHQARFGCAAAAAVLAVSLFASPASAVVTPIGIADFSAGSTLVTFAGLGGANVNGLTTGGLTFAYLVDGVPSDTVFVGVGPGITNNLPADKPVSNGIPTGTIVVTLPNRVTHFGYGFAVLAGGTLANATSMTVFNGGTSIGSLSFGAAPDPMFSGGFAGLRSTTGFDRVEMTFSGGPAFAFGNVRYGAVPEPMTWASMLLGFAAIGAMLRSRRARTARTA